MAAADVANAAYLWVYVAVGLVALLGGGGLYGLVKWLKRQAVRDAKLDELIDAKLMRRLDDQDQVLRNLENASRSNGLDSNTVGDIAGRVEVAVGEVKTSLDRHIGASDQIHSEMWRAINRKQDKHLVA